MVMTALSKKSNGEVFNVPGASVTTASKYMTEIVAQTGTNSKISTIDSELLFSVLGIFSPIVREVKEMLYLKREKLILDGNKFKETIGALPNTDYATGIKTTLDWVKGFYIIK